MLYNNIRGRTAVCVETNHCLPPLSVMLGIRYLSKLYATNLILCKYLSIEQENQCKY